MLNSIIREDIEEIAKNIDISKCEGNTFLITGANGLLARYIVETLIYLNDCKLKINCKIVALCRNKNDAIKKFGDYINRPDFKLLIQTVEEDIKYAKSVDYIIHAASQANTKVFYSDPVGTLSANTIGTYNLLKYANEKKVKGFLFFSSGSVYGDASMATEFVKENQYYSIDPLEITSCYSESKKMAENMCFSFHKQFNLPTKIIRIGHTYGPGIDLNDGRVFSDFIKSILNNQDLVIKSDGEAKRAFCYLTDAINAFFLVLFNGKAGEAYNMSNNDCFVSVKELAKILTKKVFKDKGIGIVFNYSEGKYTVNNKGNVSICTNKIYKLGWEPKISIEEGFRRTVRSFQDEINFNDK